MDGNKQKTISFRLNMVREDEKELYEAIKGHSDCYGSSGAYIKAALKHFHSMEQEYELQECLQDYMKEQMEQLVVEQRKVFMEALEEHDQKLVTMILSGVNLTATVPVVDTKENAIATAKVTNHSKKFERSEPLPVEEFEPFPDADEDIPEEALAYLGL